MKKRIAQYHASEGQGHLYILNAHAAAKVGLVDLATLTVDGYRPRTIAQSAWLIGPLKKQPIPQDCYIAQITAPCDVLRDYARGHGLVDTNTLFPPHSEDPILKALLGLPWDEIKSDSALKELPAFRRALDLPEYHPSLIKIAPSSTAFYRGKNILEIQESIDGAAEGGVLVRVPDSVLYGTADQSKPPRFPCVEKLLRDNGSVAFEADTLIKHTQLAKGALYQKGIGVLRRKPDLFEVCELTVIHPGLEMTGAGFTRGWFYRRQPDGLWAREENSLECQCGSEVTHDYHISALHIAEAYLKDEESSQQK